jgi:hypothetical protein
MGQPNACIFNSACMHVPLQPEFGRMPVRFFLCAAYWLLILILSPCYCRAHWKWKVGPRKKEVLLEHVQMPRTSKGHGQVGGSRTWRDTAAAGSDTSDMPVGISPLLRRVKPGHPPAMYVCQSSMVAARRARFRQDGIMERRSVSWSRFTILWSILSSAIGFLWIFDILVDRTCMSISFSDFHFISISYVVRISAIFCSSFTILLQCMAGCTMTGSESTNPPRNLRQLAGLIAAVYPSVLLYSNLNLSIDALKKG